MPGFHTTSNNTNYTFYTANGKNTQRPSPVWLPGHWRALGCEQVWRTLLWYWQDPAPDQPQRWLKPLPLPDPEQGVSLQPCLLKGQYFGTVTIWLRLSHAKIWGTQLPGTKIQAAQKALHGVCCFFEFSSALLLAQSAAMFKPCHCLYLYIFIFYCCHVLSPS